jgi:hypothetical protein
MGVTNRPDDHGELVDMARRTQETMRRRDITFLADKGYWGAEGLEVCKEESIDCIVCPQGSRAGRGGKEFSLDAFIYEKSTDCYICPEGERLASKSRSSSKKRLYANREACLACEAAGRCKSTGLSFRRIIRKPEHDIHDWGRERYLEHSDLYKQRQQIVEHPFGTIKHAMGGYHFLLRGMDKVKCEAALLFTGYNLKRSKAVLGFDAMMAKLDEYAALVGACRAFLLLSLGLTALIEALSLVSGGFMRFRTALCSSKGGRARICLA